jgi:membrane-bound lytic murein transglycosylase D
VEDKRSSWRFHIVRPGESLDSIALSMHAHPSEIEAANRLASYDAIAPGDELVVPVAAAAVPHPAHYITRAGDTLVTIADRFNITVDQLRRWNHLTSSAVKPQRTLDVAEPVHLAPVTHVRAKTTAATAGKTALATSTAKSTTAKSTSSSRKPAAKKPASGTVAKKPPVKKTVTSTN